MRLYSAFDLHLSNRYLGIIDETGKKVFTKKLPNNPEVILDSLVPFKNDIVCIVVESTYNWYWLVDLLMDWITDTHNKNCQRFLALLCSRCHTRRSVVSPPSLSCSQGNP
jgi:hypothetical protein